MDLVCIDGLFIYYWLEWLVVLGDLVYGKVLYDMLWVDDVWCWCDSYVVLLMSLVVGNYDCYFDVVRLGFECVGVVIYEVLFVLVYELYVMLDYYVLVGYVYFGICV